MKKRKPLQVDLSNRAHNIINKRVRGKRLKGYFLEKLLDFGEKKKFDPFKEEK